MADGILARTERLVWREGTEADVAALHAIASDFDVVRQTETWPWPPDLDFTTKRCLPNPEYEGHAGIITCEDEVIGLMGVGKGGMGYMLAPAHWGKGFATEIGRAAVDLAFERHDWPKLSACVFSDNPASGRVLEKLGFRVVEPCEGPSAARGGIFPIINYVLERPKA